jgi:hypothetical protein
MKRLSFGVLTIVAAFGIGSAALADNDKDADTLNQISGYRQWTRVNPDPVEVSVPVTRIAGAVAIDPAVLGG